MNRTSINRIIPNNVYQALINALNPSGTNVFITAADLVAAAFTLPTALNYSALPPAASVPNQIYNVLNSQGSKWRPVWLGGADFYPSGIYQSIAGVWEYVGEFPYQATQIQVDAGTDNETFVTPLTLANASKWNTKLDLSTFQAQNQLTKEPTGYPNRVDSTFSFDDGTRTFTIQPVGVSFDFWTQGEQHTITTAKTIVLPNITAKYFIYFDDTETLGTTVVFDDSILNDKVLTSVVYYNSTTGKGEFIYDERHGLTMDWATHFHLHNAFGTRYYGGFGASYTISDGSLDSHGQIALSTGTIADEDIPTTIIDSATPSAFFEQVLSPIALLPTIYKLGTLEWQKDIATSYPYKLVAGIPQYNLDTLGTHTLENVTDGSFFAVWIFAMPEINTPIISVIGTREDTSLADAKNNNNFGTIDWGDLPSQEYKALYRLIFKYDTTFTNTNKVALAEADDLRGAIDAVLTSSTLSPVSVHSGLIGLNSDDHTQYYNQTRGDLRYLQLTNVASSVLGTLLTGLSVVTAQVITSTDTVLLALGYLQAQITALVPSPKIKSGIVAAGTFAGNPKKATVTFGTAFTDANYSVSVIGIDSRAWSIESVAAGSFVINARANANLTGNVYWTATKNGEN